MYIAYITNNIHKYFIKYSKPRSLCAFVQRYVPTVNGQLLFK